MLKRPDIDKTRPVNHVEVTQGPTSVGVDYGIRFRVSTVEK